MRIHVSTLGLDSELALVDDNATVADVIRMATGSGNLDRYSVTRRGETLQPTDRVNDGDRLSIVPKKIDFAC